MVHRPIQNFILFLASGSILQVRARNDASADLTPYSTPAGTVIKVDNITIIHRTYTGIGQKVFPRLSDGARRRDSPNLEPTL